MPFGESAKNYHQARKTYPKKVFDLIINQMSCTDKKLLDLGCGTGIATVELKNRGFSCIGCDYDHTMLKEALLHGPIEIKYFAASANNLPLFKHQFDAVTAFGAFHWFYDNGSVNEIKRILKKGGVLFIINKNDTSEFRKDIIKLLNNLLS